MSAENIARWNAIPMERQETRENNGQHTLKRPRSNGEDGDSDDDVSLVSRSPSPIPADAMDIDKYDEYVRGVEREVVTVHTKIKASNKGFAMLAKLGWVEGQPLGLSGDGRVDPVPFYVKNDLIGLGKSNQDVRMIESTVSQRRGLDSERQTKETEEQRRAREDSVVKRAALQSEISTTLRAFYCELCDKQFQNVAQYDEHTNSYAHHHKARLKDMQASQRVSSGSKEELDKRKEKERKREEKELRKIAKAAGIKMAKPPTSSLVSAGTPSAAGISDNESKPSGFKKSGWATVGSVSSFAPAEPVPLGSPPPREPQKSGSVSMGSSSAPTNQWTSPPPSSSGFKQAGWAGVGSTPSSSGGWASVPEPPQSSSFPPPPASSSPTFHPPMGPAPAFRTGGWTSLDTGSSHQLPRSVPQHSPLSPSAASSPPVTISSVEVPQTGGWSSAVVSNTLDTAQNIRHSPPPVQMESQPAQPPEGLSTPRESQPAAARQKSSATARQETSRSGWQQFRSGGPGRRK